MSTSNTQSGVHVPAFDLVPSDRNRPLRPLAKGHMYPMSQWYKDLLESSNYNLSTFSLQASGKMLYVPEKIRARVIVWLSEQIGGGPSQRRGFGFNPKDALGTADWTDFFIVHILH
jgi:hypothetical protein